MWEHLQVPILRRVGQRDGYAAWGTQKAAFGYDLADRRQFEVGDSPRSVNLRHLAKFGEFQVVEKRPDRRANVIFLLDISASQSLGTRMSKRQLASLTVSRLGTACLAQGHAVNCIAFSERIERETGFVSARSVWQSRIADLSGVRPRHRTTNPTEALEQAWALCSGPSGAELVFVVSDFLFEPQRRRLEDLYDIADVVVLMITDPLEERSIPFFGLVVFQDAESGDAVSASGVTSRDPARYVTQLGIDRCTLTTQESEHQQFVRLQDFFRERPAHDERRL